MMKFKESFEKAFKGMGHSISRYPLTVLFLLGVAGLNATMIEDVDQDYARLIFTLVVGAMLSIVGQTIHERFSKTENTRYILMGVAVVLTAAYYFVVGPRLQYDTNLTVKTGVALFALLNAFIWIPSIKNEFVTFHRSFLSVVKAFFTSSIFSVVLFLGFGAIYSAINSLLFTVSYTVLLHIFNLIVALFAPIYFLSMTPNYAALKEDAAISQAQVNDEMREQFNVPRFLEVLISYIIIPLLAIYTTILILYVLLNITGDFWTNNLLEPLLVSFAVIGIIVLTLSYNIENRFTVIFRNVFPKILIPVVVFQTIASILKIREMGITHGRYYVILFGIFATIAGFIFSFMKPKQHGYIAAVLLVLATISIVPPVDAFTVSKHNQINKLETILVENNMISDGTVVPNPEASMEDRVVITNTMNYLRNMGYEDEISFLPEGYEPYRDFQETFGFPTTYTVNDTTPEGQQGHYVYFQREGPYIYKVAGYDVMFQQNLYYHEDEEPEIGNPIQFVVDQSMFTYEREVENGYYSIVIKDAEGSELIRYSTKEIFDEILGEALATEYIEKEIDEAEATFETENDNVRLKLVVDALSREEEYNQMDLYIMIDIVE